MKLTSKLYLIVIFAILYIPLVYLAYYSFNSGKTMIDFEGFSWKHYVELFENTRMMVIVINTLVVALLCGLFSAVLGTTVGFTMFPDGSIIWASVAPAAATIWTPPTLFPVAFPPGTNSFSAPPVTVKLP